MQILFLVFLFAVNVSGAPDGSDSSGSPACLNRTELSIIRSCLATIFASTWLAVHPNVPGLNLTKEEPRWWIFGRPTIMCSIERAKLMLVAILAPEVMVGWAIRQFLVARKVRTYSSKDHELKLVHGFFVSMGGFYYGKEERLVTLNDVPMLLKSLAKVRAVDIKDKSKGDALSKTIVILQLSWFAIQCCTRPVLKLPITLLEISTLAFAVLSTASYAAWWEKPVDVQYQIRLEEPSSIDTGQDGPHEVTVSLDVDPEPTADLSPARRTIDNPDDSPRGSSSDLIELLPLPNTASSKPTMGYNSGWPHNSPAIETAALMDTESSPGHEVYAEQSPVLEFIHGCSEFLERCGKRASRSYTWIYFKVMGFIFADDIGSGVDRPVLNAATGAAGMSSCNGGMATEADDFSVHLLAVVVVGCLFGAIHCMAWSSSFPSFAEKVLWRTSSLAMIIGLLYGVLHMLSQRVSGDSELLIMYLQVVITRPLQWILIRQLSQWARKVFERNGRILVFMNRYFPRNNFELFYTILEYISAPWNRTTYDEFMSVALSVLAIVIYSIARVTLIVLALLQFRLLPPLALCTVEWTTFIPHI